MSRVRTVFGLSFVLVVAALLTASSAPVTAHGGGLDAYGGYNDNKVGNYHAHQGSCAGRTSSSKAEAIRAGCRRDHSEGGRGRRLTAPTTGVAAQAVRFFGRVMRAE